MDSSFVYNHKFNFLTQVFKKNRKRELRQGSAITGLRIPKKTLKIGVG